MKRFADFILEKNGLWDNIHKKRQRIKNGSGERMRKPGEKGAPTKQDFINANEEREVNHDYEFSMARSQLKTIIRDATGILKHIQGEGEMEAWMQSKLTLAVDYVGAVADNIISGESEIKPVSEATYKGKQVTLNKPMPGDVKKSKVYVDPDGDGKATKVNFGDKNMSIKKNNPDRKRSYCARSKPLGNDKTKANYWSRKAWDC